MAERDDIPERLTLGDALDVPLRPVASSRYVDFVPVGQGGMGIVYWALDSELKRQVAFKVIRPPSRDGKEGVTPPAPLTLRTPEGEDDVGVDAYDEMRARFLQEAWVTGGMEHPGIVPVYELGQTEGGVPYYTMKFVRGSTTLGTALDEAQTLDERLELLEAFLKVCDTMRYAHSRGVVHRDLKPDNIALGEFGEVVVLDWGLAKLEGEPEAASRPESRWQGDVRAFRDSTGLETSATAVGTPGYMAPEAAKGLIDDLDARSDVYSLGAILYELLTGRRAFEFRTFQQYGEQVVSTDAPDARQACPEVPEGLAAICRAAMARSREARTASVDALARSIRAWRTDQRTEQELRAHRQEAEARLAAAEGTEGEALQRTLDAAALACRRALEIRPEDAEAQASLARVDALRAAGIAAREKAARGRLLRRVGAIALVVALVSAAIVAAVLESRRREAEDARRDAAAALARAEADRARAEDAMGFMVGEMQQKLEPLGRLDLLASIGAKARSYYRTLGELALEERTPDSLRNGAVALRDLGDVHRAQGQLPAAQEAYEMGLELAEALAAVGAEDGDLQVALARGRLGAVLTAKGYATRAVTMLTGQVELARARAEASPDDDARQAALAEAYHTLGAAQTDTFDLDGALVSAQAALDIARRLSEHDDDEGTYHRARVRYLLAPSRALRVRDRVDELDARVQRALAIVAEWRAKRPDDARWHAAQGDALIRAGLVAEVRADHATALAHYDGAREVYETLRARDPSNLKHTHALAFVLHRMGWAILRLEAAKGTPESEVRAHAPYWRQAYELHEALVTTDPSNASWMRAMIDLCDRMATVARIEGATPLVIERYREEALACARRLMECDEGNVLWMHLYAYALFQHAVRRYEIDPETSRARLRESAALCKRLAPIHPDALAEIAVLHSWAQGRMVRDADEAAARRMDDESIALLEQAYAAGRDVGVDQELLNTLARQGRRLAEGSQADRERARTLYARARSLHDALAERWPDNADLRKAAAARERQLDALRDELAGD